MTKAKDVLIVDCYGLVFRAYYAMDEMVINGVNVNAVFGFLRLMLSILKQFNPNKIVITLDSGKQTIKAKEFPIYKSNRGATPEDLKPQFAIIKEAIKAMGIQNIQMEGYEADDIIASLCQNNKSNIMIVSADKDLCALVSDNIKIYNHQKKEIMDRNYVIEKFGIDPEYFVDYLSLVGDVADNIPGVFSIGPKKASNLINKYKSLDCIYENIDNINDQKVKEALINGKETAYISKKMVNFNFCNVPEVEDYKINNHTLRKFCAKYQFHSILKSIPEEDLLL